jgi:hypothetical protein
MGEIEDTLKSVTAMTPVNATVQDVMRCIERMIDVLQEGLDDIEHDIPTPKRSKRKQDLQDCLLNAHKLHAALVASPSRKAAAAAIADHLMPEDDLH